MCRRFDFGRSRRLLSLGADDLDDEVSKSNAADSIGGLPLLDANKRYLCRGVISIDRFYQRLLVLMAARSNS